MEAFLHRFLLQFSHYCLCFNLISSYFTPLYGFYWGGAGFITPISARSEGQAKAECFCLLVSIEPDWFGYLLLILSSFIVFCPIRILFNTTLRYSLCIYCWIKYSSSLLQYPLCRLIQDVRIRSNAPVNFHQNSLKLGRCTYNRFNQWSSIQI